jgi:hypothetical protein
VIGYYSWFRKNLGKNDVGLILGYLYKNNAGENNETNKSLHDSKK